MRTGPMPKNVKHSRGANDWVDIPDVPYDGPGRRPLPVTTGIHWFPQVEAWWEVLTSMPHCVLWKESDWVAALDLAYLKNSFWGEMFGGAPSMAMATEIRRREDNMGFTAEARRKLRIRYVEATPGEEQRPETDSAEDVTSAVVVSSLDARRSARRQAS